MDKSGKAKVGLARRAGETEEAEHPKGYKQMF